MAKPQKIAPSSDSAEDREAIEEFAERRINARGARVYQETYSRARVMKDGDAKPASIREALLRPPTVPAKDRDGTVPLAKRKEYEAETRMSAIRDRAIKDACQGRSASY